MTELAISKRRRPRRSREQWRQLVAGHIESGLSVDSYCEGEGVSTASFYRWRTLLGGDVARAPAGKTEYRRSRGAGSGVLRMNSRPTTPQAASRAVEGSGTDLLELHTISTT